MGKNLGATKQDLAELEERMSKSMEGVVHEILNALSPEIQEIKQDISSLQKDVSGLQEDNDGLKATAARIERKLDATIERTDDHGVRIGRLEAKAA